MLISEEQSKLAPVAECLLRLLQPFEWNNVYVPYLPELMLEYLDAPVPFLMGTLQSNLQQIRNKSEIVLVDLDSKKVHSEEDIPSLPAPIVSYLYKDLHNIVANLES